MGRLGDGCISLSSLDLPKITLLLGILFLASCLTPDVFSTPKSDFSAPSIRTMKASPFCQCLQVPMEVWARGVKHERLGCWLRRLWVTQCNLCAASCQIASQGSSMIRKNPKRYRKPFSPAGPNTSLRHSSPGQHHAELPRFSAWQSLFRLK